MPNHLEKKEKNSYFDGIKPLTATSLGVTSAIKCWLGVNSKQWQMKLEALG